MANEPSSRPSFSLRQRWGIFLSVIISIAAVFALVVMLNYLGARYYLRFPWSIQTRTELSSQTRSVLNSLTNDINVIIYYDKDDLLYGKIRDLLDDYRFINPKISVRTVDYLKDHADAEKVKDAYHDRMAADSDTNLVIFISANGTNIVSGEKLGQYEIDPVASEGPEREFRNRLKFFFGEKEFTSIIFGLMSAHPVRAYFFENLKSHHRLNGETDEDYKKFKLLLQNNNIDVTNISTFPGTNGVPADCKLLIIAGPDILTHQEVDNVRRYLEQGGRLFVLFSFRSREINTGLEPLLADWGVAVGHNIIHDRKNYFSESGDDVVVNSFNKYHPVVSHLQGASLELVLPRSIGTNSNNNGPEAPAAQELAWTGTSTTIDDNPIITGRRFPLIVAVEKNEAKGITDQGTTRILVVGDSYVLDNQLIDAAANPHFAAAAVNWLVGQGPMLQGVGPEVVKEYKLMLTPERFQNIRWIFLAGMPGAILLFGGLVWLRRRR